jgi:hypothetical protein
MIPHPPGVALKQGEEGREFLRVIGSKTVRAVLLGRSATAVYTDFDSCG